MAKQDNLEVFLDHLIEDLDWRKKEIGDLLFLANSSNEHLIMKSAVLLIYSHWEGYVKNACKHYLKYVSDQKVPLRNLTFNFEAISLKGQIKSAYESNNSLTLTNELNLVEKFYDSNEAKFNLPNSIIKEKNKDFINTHDNLNLKILNSFLKIVGIGEIVIIKGREKYIDENLLNQRNAIGHGTKVDPDSQEFDLSLKNIYKVRDFIFMLMEYVQSELTHYSENYFYLYENTNKARIRRENQTTLLQRNMKILFNK
ncbi:MAE_28990/MAE_18760 family HEPN-like nuclease [Vibrio sp. 10N.286.46.A8]|uniref:MAE_28990/MAE_18760 family HEPN-like nuclease n=1 Tax=Vibrio sp. 10N.286.46.A8 TaxID=3229697 RepID=UPI00354FA657